MPTVPREVMAHHLYRKRNEISERICHVYGVTWPGSWVQDSVASILPGPSLLVLRATPSKGSRAAAIAKTYAASPGPPGGRKHQ